tara:strand:- start:1 stop:132 length:132 start_codon:yes stop_codon:yes gene_type:complete
MMDSFHHYDIDNGGKYNRRKTDDHIAKSSCLSLQDYQNKLRIP